MAAMIKIPFQGNVSKALAFKLLLLFLSYSGLAQERSKSNIKEIVSAGNAHSADLAPEKLYLQTDRPYYFSGDTLWFKSYLFDESDLTASSKSGLFYVEIVSDSNKVVKRLMLPVTGGMSAGQISLDDREVPQGGYTLRAYTRWMLNFGEEHVFTKQFYVVNPTDKDWLIESNSYAVQDSAYLNLKINRSDKVAVALREMQIRIADRKRTLLRESTETDLNGALHLAFGLPPKTKAADIAISLVDMRKGEGNRKLHFPLRINRPEYADLQFLPEGGELVAGLPASIAFKAVNEDGLAADLSGLVYDSKQKEAAAFKSEHKGMGSFTLLPMAGETYTAKVRMPDGSFKAYPLPAVRSSGTALEVKNSFKSDSCEVILRASADVIASGQLFYLAGQSRGMVRYGASFVFKKTPVVLKIAKEVFPEGIARFVLLGPDKRALNERMVFIDHHDRLHIEVVPNKPSFVTRDSVGLNVKVTDKDGKPVQGYFSMSVTDDGQVSIESVGDGSILTNILLAGDLKGNVEEPGYYLKTAMDATKWTHLDLLLLTQGWAGYDWEAVFKSTAPFKHPAEREFLIKGKVTNMFNKPVAGSGLTLFSKKPVLILDTISNAQGAFTFRNVFPVDTAVFFIQARNKKGKSFNVGIEVEEFTPPVFAGPIRSVQPWYMNTETGRYRKVNKTVQLKKNLARLSGGNVLREVVIKGKKIIKDSKNLNGAGGADIIIDEKDLEKAGKTSLGDLLYKNVRGFGYSADKTGQVLYRINGMAVHLVIDGVNTEYFLPEGMSAYQFLKQYFDYYDAEEIKGIEVMSSTRYESIYRTMFLGPLAEPWANVFIEVTTRGGRGPFMKKSVGTYLYKPLAFTLPKKFYTPKYSVAARTGVTDIRPTIFWEPGLITDVNGEAAVCFYTADNPGSYTVIIEGSDMQGRVGEGRANIVVGK